jgi:DNA repair protein RecO (recombination protein O)
MSRPREYQTEAVIIRKTRLGEADRILSLYTPDLGKIQAVAKGVRKVRSKMSGHLELCTHSAVSLARGRSLDTITGTRTIHGYYPLKTDLWRISCGMYVCELVERFTADHDANRGLYELLLETLERLCHDEINNLSLPAFELALLDRLGYRPRLQECASCSRPLAGKNWFAPAAGGILCPDCGRRQSYRFEVSSGARQTMAVLQQEETEANARLQANTALSGEVTAILRRYMRYLLERDIRSAAWLDCLRNRLGEPAVSPASLRPAG